MKDKIYSVIWNVDAINCLSTAWDCTGTWHSDMILNMKQASSKAFVSNYRTFYEWKDLLTLQWKLFCMWHSKPENLQQIIKKRRKKLSRKSSNSWKYQEGKRKLFKYWCTFACEAQAFWIRSSECTHDQ